LELLRVDTYRSLEETCSLALDLLDCDLAWLLEVEDETLYSRALASAKGESAAEVFLWRLHGKAAQHAHFPFDAQTNALAALLIAGEPSLNVPVDRLRQLPDGVRFARALSQLRHAYCHALPIHLAQTPIGLLILATDASADIAHWQNAHLLRAIMTQACIALQNLRLTDSIAAREAQMRADQAFLKRVLDTMGDGLLVLDEEARVRYVNNRLLLMSEYTRQELYGCSVGMLFHVNTRDMLVRNLRRGGRGTLGFSQQLVTRSGRVVPVLMSRATTHSDGVEHTILVLSDLTEQKLREQALERQGERLRALNQAVQALNAAFDQARVVALLLRATHEMTGCAHVRLFLAIPDQTDLFHMVTEQNLQSPSAAFEQVHLGQSAAGRAAVERRSQLVRAEEQSSAASAAEQDDILALPLAVAEQLIGVLEIRGRAEDSFSCDDVEFLENLAAAAAAAFEKAALYQSLKQRAEALQRTYDELREAERLKDNLLQSLSHELKTPLHKIIMQLQILDDEMYGSLNAEQHSSLRAALGWSAQLASIVDEIVIVQALSADDLQFAAVDLARLTAQAIRKVRLLAGELQLEIAVEISPNLPLVRGDERHLLTVVEQLLDNAVKFSPEGAQIEVKIAQDSASTVLLCVRDHGIGIPEALHKRIFERGYQAESGITRRFGGVGLGLAMVRRIVEAHNGKVWVESAVGEGSAFYVQLNIC
jgi:PAS domain S-box-containing protein